MGAHVTRLSGEEWQNWANRLLTQHYGHAEYQKVPDNDRGDAGIEGYTLTEGVAYQAYGCEEPLKTSERYEKQRTKMTQDIGKFINNEPTLARIFGSVKITRWVLFVPSYDSKDIVAHASKKTKEVLDANLSYVDESFQVVISEEDDFEVARDQLINAGNRALQIEADQATQQAMDEWANLNVGLMQKLDEKTRKMPTLASDEQRRDFVTKVLKWHLEGQAILEALRQHPDVYAKVVKAKSHRENFLVRAALAEPNTAGSILTSAIDGLLETLGSEVRELHTYSAESLAHEAVSDWLLRCPLDFPEVRDG